MKTFKLILKYMLLLIIAVVFLFPVVYMIACSFMTQTQASNMIDFSDGKFKSIELIPDRVTGEQYYQVFFRRPDYLMKFWNSVTMTIPTVIGHLVVSVLAAFAFAKLKFPLRNKLFFVYIMLLILPLQVTIVPNYIILDNFDLLNSFLSIILPGTFSAFGICLLRQSMMYISDASIEAARIDGAGYFRVFTKIVLPQIKGGLITLVLLCFVDCWNIVEQPLIYFDDNAMYPLSVTISDISSSDCGVVFACGVMFMIPPLLVYFYGHNDIKSPFVKADS